MPSVTEILDTFPEAELVAWKLRMGAKKVAEIGTEAKRIGSTVDVAIQTMRRTGTPPAGTPDPAIAHCLRGWQQFTEEHPALVDSITGMQTERQRGDILGHPDFEVRRVEGWGFLSLKCAGQIRPVYWTQEAAYSWLRNAEVNATYLGILRLDKEGKGYELQELMDPEEIDYEVQVWLNYLTLYRHRERVAHRARTWKEEASACGIG